MGRLPFTVVFNDDSSSEEEKEQTHVKSERLQLRAAMEASSRDAEKKEKEKAGRKRPRKEAALKQEKKPKVEKKKEKETRREKQKSRSKAERKASAEAEKPQDGTTEGEEKAVDSRDKKAVSMEEEPQAHGRKRRAISNASDNGVRAQAEQQKEDTKQEDAPEAAKATRNSRSDGNTSEPTRRRLKRPSSAMTNASKKDGDDAKTPAEANERVKVKKHKFSDQLRSRKPPAEKRGKRELPAKAASLDDYLKEEASRAREPETVRAPVKKSEKKRPAPQSLNEYLDATKDKKRPKDLNGRHEGKHGVAKEAADSEKTEAREEWASGNRPKFKSSDGEQADDSRKLETNKDDEIVENSEQPTENGSVDRSEHTEEDEPKVNQVTPQQDVISTVVASEAPVSQDDSAPTLESSSHVAAVSPTKSEDQCSNVQNDSSSSKAPVDSEAPQPSLNGLDDDEEEGTVSDQEPVPVAVETQASQTVSESSETPAEPVVDPMSFVIPKKRVVRDLSKNESSDMTSLSSARTTTVSNGDAGVPRMSPSASPSAAEITPVNVVEETKKTPRTKGVVPPTMPHLSNDEKHYMRLAKKSNSLLKPAAMIVSRDKSLKPHMLSAFGNISDRYGVIVDGKPLHEEKKRMWCPTRKEIKKSGNPPAFFGVNMDAPLHGVDKTAENVETQDTDIKKSAPIPCYERLEFERPEEREWYQQQFYGTKFIPQMLRERVTLVMHNARYVRRATGLLFNAQRDKEEYMEQLEERYKVKDRKPRCDILQKNWQQLVNGRVAFVFLHYKTREDAVAARAQYKDDDGRALTFKGESRNADHPSGNGRAGSTPIRMSPSPPPGPSHRPRSPRRPPHEDRDWNRRDRRPSFNVYDGRMNGRYGPGQHPRSPGGQPPRRRSRSRSWSRPQPLHPDSQRVYPGDRPHADDNRSSQSSNPEASQTSHHSQDPTGISQDSLLEEGETMGKDHTHGGDQKAGWSNGERPSPNHHRRSRSRSRPRMRDNKDHPHGGHRGYDERSRGPHPMDRCQGRSPPPHHYWGDRGDRRHMNERDRHHSGDHFHRPSHPHDQRPSDRRPGPHDDYHRRQRDEEFRRGRFQNDMRDYH